MEIKKANDLLSPRPAPKKKGGRPRKPLSIAYGKTLTPDEILTCKIRILELLEQGKARTVTEACEVLQIPAIRAHGWARTDKEFAESVQLAREIVADQVEANLIGNRNVIAQIFLLKGYRPKFRDNYKAELDNPNLLKLLEELKAIGQRQLAAPKITAVTVEPAKVEEKPWEKPKNDNQ